jgi:hypothetical protein
MRAPPDRQPLTTQSALKNTASAQLDARIPAHQAALFMLTNFSTVSAATD